MNRYWSLAVGAPLIVALGVGVYISVGGARPGVEQLRKNFASLEDDMQDAHQGFLKVMREWRDKVDAAGGDRDAVPKPPDPRVVVMTQMDALVDTALKTDAGAALAAQAYLWSIGLEIDMSNAIKRFDRLAANFPNDPILAEPVSSAQSAWNVTGDPEGWTRTLERLVETTTIKDTRLGALYAMGRIRMLNGDPAGAKQAFQAIVAQQPGSETLKQVNGYLYELDHLQPGMVAPDISSRTLDGKDITLASLRGKPVLVVFWATWCAICMGEMPYIHDALSAMRERGMPFEVLAVSLDETDENLNQKADSFNVPGIRVWQSGGWDTPVAGTYHVIALPTWYLVDAQGVIRARDPLAKKLLPALEALAPPSNQ